MGLICSLGFRKSGNTQCDGQTTGIFARNGIAAGTVARKRERGRQILTQIDLSHEICSGFAARSVIHQRSPRPAPAHQSFNLFYVSISEYRSLDPSFYYNLYPGKARAIFTQLSPNDAVRQQKNVF